MLRKINQVGAAGLAEWRQLWNGEVLPLLQRMRIVAGGGITVDQYPFGTIIGALPTTTTAENSDTPAVGYSSYFTLSVTGSTASTITVGIADGATGSNSVAVVNGGTTYSLPPYTATVSGETVFCLAYTPAQYNSGGVLVSSASMAISAVSGAVLPSGGTSGAYYMQLGRVVGSSGAALRIVQDHTAGVAYFNWYVRC